MSLIDIIFYVIEPVQRAHHTHLRRIQYRICDRKSLFITCAARYVCNALFCRFYSTAHINYSNVIKP